MEALQTLTQEGYQFISINQITVREGRRPLRNIEELAKSIDDIGLMNPITVHPFPPYVLVAGYHRLEACRLLGWDEIPAYVLTDADIDRLAELKTDPDMSDKTAIDLGIELMEIDENLIRNELTTLERAEQLARRKEVYEALHPEARKPNGGRRSKNAEMISAFADDTAEKTGVTARTVRQEVQIATKIDDDVKESIRDTDVADNKTELLTLARQDVDTQKAVAKMITAGKAKNVTNALKAVRLEKRHENLAHINEGNTDLAEVGAKYSLILADPPWSYKDTSFVAGVEREVEEHYPTLSIDEIRALPVAELASDDCVLFMWATSPKLSDAMDVIRSWGFTYRTCMVWVKDRIGMGYFARQRHELLLIAVKGNPPVPAVEDRPDSVIESPRGKHSEKPEKSYELIEQMYPHAVRVELFARGKRNGWSVWGNQAN